ncbi:MAG: DUF4390 domain-containing protein [Deltaproteobacteria bacterium]|nr:DUF4390 domain-containing protein [Deltaproteobacteria bacterium]MBW2118082.1 DUF4390 domain-containing protein [Deltaproteobacteria bacterium]MBW2343448.1 DUF4390 domain-containing protein [Deltaproteobacteria bacterium]
MHFFTKKITVLAVVTLFLHFSLLVPTLKAEEACIKDIDVVNSWDHCILSFSVTGCFTEEMKKAIDNGINTTFTFYIELYEIRDLWWDREIADLSVSHYIKYDNLKKIYTVTLSEKENKVFYTNDFNEAKKLMSEIRGFGITRLHNLQKGKRYQVRMMAELDKITLPFYLDYILFFLSLWDFETDWYTVDFSY